MLDLSDKNITASGRTALSLVVKPDVLESGVAHTFTLQVTSLPSGAVSNASIVITASTPPTGIYLLMCFVCTCVRATADIHCFSVYVGGTFSITPAAGFALSTTFILSCDAWTSPIGEEQGSSTTSLHYSFAYLWQGSYAYLRTTSLANVFSATLPSPSLPQNNTIILRCVFLRLLLLHILLVAVTEYLFQGRNF